MSEVNITITIRTRWWFRPALMAFAIASVLMPRRLRDKVWSPAISWIVRHSTYAKSDCK